MKAKNAARQVYEHLTSSNLSKLAKLTDSDPDVARRKRLNALSKTICKLNVGQIQKRFPDVKELQKSPTEKRVLIGAFAVRYGMGYHSARQLIDGKWEPNALRYPQYFADVEKYATPAR